jgi:hypothetical protein
LLALLADVAAGLNTSALPLSPRARHERRPNPWGRLFRPTRGKKNDTLTDHGKKDLYFVRRAPLSDIDTLAVCNDGSGAPLYFHNGTDPNLWMVYLQGGEWCWDAASCAARWQTSPFLMSNTGKQLKPPFTWMGGIFEATARNPMAAANMIYLPYCSSDAWVGDTAAANTSTTGALGPWGNWDPNNLSTYYFEGSRILAAALSALVNEYGLGAQALRAASEGLPRPVLVLGGCRCEYEASKKYTALTYSSTSDFFLPTARAAVAP